MAGFLKTLDRPDVIGDGAMGTELIALGGDPSRLAELNLSRPELVRSVHSAYAEAGARLHRTNTFTANRLRLAACGLAGKVREINLAAASIAREAAGKGDLIAGCIGPLAGVAASPEERGRAYQEQASALAEGGCDLLVLETFTEGEELERAVGSARGYDLPVVAQVVVGEDLRCRDGIEVAAVLHRARAAGANCLGVNCTSPGLALRALRSVRGLEWLSAFPSAGPPGRIESPESFAGALAEVGEARACIVGGCCGAGPAHIRALAATLRRPRPSA